MRVAAALLLAPLFLAAAYVGGPLFLAVVLILAAQGAREFGRMALPGARGASALILTAAVAFAAARFVAPGGEAVLAGLVTLAVVGALVLGLAAPDPPAGADGAARTLLGALYVGWLFSSLVALRELPRVVPGLPYSAGFDFLLVPVLLTWSSDIAAYFAGRAWGRRKLLPRVSPGKTVAGALGGAAAAAIVAVVLFGWGPDTLPALSPPAAAAVGLSASALAQAGDLAESLLKRASRVKDSAQLIPGHGGVLDRFDALLFTAPAAHLFFLAVLG